MKVNFVYKQAEIDRLPALNIKRGLCLNISTTYTATWMGKCLTFQSGVLLNVDQNSSLFWQYRN